MSDSSPTRPVDYIALCETAKARYAIDASNAAHRGETIDHDDASALAYGFQSLARTLTALHKAANGCGEPISWLHPADAKCRRGWLCAACRFAQFNAITVLTPTEPSHG